MPYLKRIRVRDYPPLRDAKVDFKPGLNIIIGSNGAGKTRFITLANKLLDLQQEHFDGAGCEIVIAEALDELATVFDEKANPYHSSLRTSTSVSDQLSTEPSTYTPSPLVLTSKLGSNSIETKTLGDAIARLTKKYPFQYSPLLIRHGIPASGLPIIDENGELVLAKRTVSVNLKAGASSMTEVESRFIQTVARTIVGVIRNGFSVLNGVPVLPMKAEEARNLVVQAIDAYLTRLNNCLPLYSPIQAVRYGDYFQVYYQESSDQYTIKGLVLEYQLQYEWLAFSALSDGTKRLFYILAELLCPTSVSLNKFTGRIHVVDEAKIIFLEEPELGIHPDQLQKLLSLVREVSGENQVILTTHAPQVLDMLGKEELDRITICELDPKKGTQFRKLSAAKKAKAKAYMRDDSYLSDFWRFSNLEAAD